MPRDADAPMTDRTTTDGREPSLPVAPADPLLAVRDLRGARLWPEHRRTLSAIDAGDVDAAAATMASHVRQSRVGDAARSSDRASAVVTGSAGSPAGP